MPSFSAAFTTANAPYNIYNVIAGLQLTGVTPRTGSKVAINPPRNVSFLQITVDGLVAGILYFTSDASVSAANKVGTPLPSGDNHPFNSQFKQQAISLINKYFDIDTTGMVVHFEWE